MNSRMKTSVSKHSTGENSFEKQVSKTPKAPGTQRHNHIIDSDFTSNSSTADKMQYSAKNGSGNPHSVGRAP